MVWSCNWHRPENLKSPFEKHRNGYQLRFQQQNHRLIHERKYSSRHHNYQSFGRDHQIGLLGKISFVQCLKGKIKNAKRLSKRSLCIHDFVFWQHWRNSTEKKEKPRSTIELFFSMKYMCSTLIFVCDSFKILNRTWHQLSSWQLTETLLRLVQPTVKATWSFLRSFWQNHKLSLSADAKHPPGNLINVLKNIKKASSWFCNLVEESESLKVDLVAIFQGFTEMFWNFINHWKK